MRLENMKENIPETPEFIHRMIQDEVKNQMQAAKVISLQARKRNRRTGARLAAAAACVLAVSTVGYAGAKLYHMSLESEGAYRIAAGISADGSPGKTSLPKKMHGIDISADYIPEGMEWLDESHLTYPENGWSGGFSFSSVLLDTDDLDKVLEENNVVESEERTFGSYGGVYLRYHDLAQDGSFNQRIYLLCPDISRVITIYIGDDVTKEDAVKVAEHLVITETDDLFDTDAMTTWSELVGSETERSASHDTLTVSAAEHELTVHPIGEDFVLPAMHTDENGGFVPAEQVTVRVDSVQTSDDLHLLDGMELPQEWEDAIGGDGKLMDNTLSYIRSGDGVDTLDEVVKTETVKQKLVFATVTYTNHSDGELRHMLYRGMLVLMNQEDGGYQIYNPRERSGDGYDRVMWDGAARTGAMTFSSVRDDFEDGGNYIPSLKPGESIQLNMAWLVNENDLPHMYLALNGDGSAYAFTDSMLETGLVDIRQ